MMNYKLLITDVKKTTEEDIFKEMLSILRFSYFENFKNNQGIAASQFVYIVF